LRVFWQISRLRMLDVLRSPSASLVFLGLPLVLLLVLALVFGNGQPFERKTLALSPSAAQAPAVLALLLRHPELRVVSEASRDVGLRKLEMRAADAVLEQEQGQLQLTVGARDAIWGAGLQRLLPGAVLVTAPEPAWGYLHFLFPGLLSTTVMFAGLFGMGYAMARYRQNGFLKKLATTPLSRSTFILAQLAGRGALVVLQLGLLAAAALLGFQLRVSAPALAAALAVSLLGLFVFSGAGFVLACLIRTEAVVSDSIAALTLPLTLFSGVFFPIDVLPRGLHAVCAVLPSTLLVELTRGSLLYGAALSGDLRWLGLLAWGVAFFGLSATVFKWHA
jgi:ABC-2 type transport system permease protein